MTMKNREVFQKDPLELRLVNSGVAKVGDDSTAEELKTLRWELETFVCEKQYARGLQRILDGYLGALGKEEQKPVWVSGFFGSGKSHLVKMLRALWVDQELPGGARARGLAHLPNDLKASLKELAVQGKRLGGLHAAGGTLGSGAGGSIRLALLGVVFRSAGLPESWAHGRFVLYLKKHGWYDKVKKEVEKTGKELEKELRNLYVSPVLAKALLKVDPNFAESEAKARLLLKEEFPSRDEISEDDMIAAIHEALDVDGKLPLTLLVLDEVQQWIGEDPARSSQVNNLAECLAKRFGARVLLVATGQTALSGTPVLQRIQDRFPVKIELSDADVETVIRKIVLAKKPDKADAVEKLLDRCSGEVSRHLTGTKIGPRPEDEETRVVDYPLLPVRRRFWEKVLRAVDRAGTSGQLRTQLRVVHEAVQQTAEAPLGTVVPADFVYTRRATELIQTGVLLREIHERIEKLDDKTPDGSLASRLASLVFLIGRLPREKGIDDGVRADSDTLANLLVEDLTAGGNDLRRRVPKVLESLVKAGHLMKVDEEYRLQTKEGSAWDAAYREALGRVQADEPKMAGLRRDALEGTLKDLLGGIAVSQGKSKVRRVAELSFGPDKPSGTKGGIPVWVRDGWNEDEKGVVADVHGFGTGAPLVVVFVPKKRSEELKKALAAAKAAEETLHARGMPTTDEGREARRGMEGTFDARQQEVDGLVAEIVDDARVYLAGAPAPLEGNDLAENVTEAVGSALARLYPRFGEGDDPKWEQVFTKAKGGSPDALEAVGHKGAVEAHPVTAALLAAIGSGRKGSDLRKQFGDAPYGWPQDTIDGGLFALLAGERLRATLQGQAMGVNLDRTKIGPAEFRLEQAVVSPQQKVALRGLFQGVGLSAKPGEEIAAAAAFLSELRRRAEAAGGEPPLPERPSLTTVSELAALSGNEQLIALFEAKADLAALAKTWKERADEIARRQPAWEALGHLLAHAAPLPVAAEVEPQVEAIRSGRRLLDTPDPVPPLSAGLVDALRVELKARYTVWRERFESETKTLEADASWQKLSPADRTAILASCGVIELPAPKAGTPEELLASLDVASLADWTERLHALPSRFAEARAEAARRIAPKAVHVSLPKATLHDDAEVEKWLEETRRLLKEKLATGPVIV